MFHSSCCAPRIWHQILTVKKKKTLRSVKHLNRRILFQLLCQNDIRSSQLFMGHRRLPQACFTADRHAKIYYPLVVFVLGCNWTPRVLEILGRLLNRAPCLGAQRLVKEPAQWKDRSITHTDTLKAINSLLYKNCFFILTIFQVIKKTCIYISNLRFNKIIQFIYLTIFIR